LCCLQSASSRYAVFILWYSFWNDRKIWVYAVFIYIKKICILCCLQSASSSLWYSFWNVVFILKCGIHAEMRMFRCLKISLHCPLSPPQICMLHLGKSK